ncbi:GNAT family N-acetyltransferase [Streptomyces sp. NPDC056049]|uniref:GNAT family N-acetyltransferase n=1 Tax=Streptomyces sp. NPDC056049 TaxID=3345693 RepID=UPI0035E0AEE4
MTLPLASAFPFPFPFAFDAGPEPRECARVLAAAFAREPAVRWITGGSERARRAWFDATLRTQAALPGARRHLIADASGRPVGAVVLTPPGARPGPWAAGRWSARVSLRCGPRALVRTLLHLRAAEHLAPPGAWTLEFVGVVPEAAGRGAGRLLLDRALGGLPAPGGVFLTTADPVYVPLYRRFGFTLLEHRRVGPVTTAAMWRPGAAGAR